MNHFFNIKLNFKASFFILTAIMAILRLHILFIILFLSVLLHELAHILPAILFGLKCENIVISPIGQTASLTGFEETSWIKKIVIIISGPLFNFIVFLAFSFTGNKLLSFIANINLALCIFNLLPVYPLDGGRLLKAVLSRAVGILNANKVVFNISIVSNFILFILGFIQLILFPYNISVLCVAFYLIKINKKERSKLAFEFYKIITGKKADNKKLKYKTVKADINGELKNILNRLSFDYSLKIMLYDKKNYITTVDEKTFLNEIILRKQ